MLCDNSQTGSVFVKTVDTAEYEKFPLLLKVPGKCISDSIVIIIHRRMYGHPSGFIDHKKVFIFINNVYWQIYRFDFFRRCFLYNRDCKGIATLEGMIYMDGLTV